MQHAGMVNLFRPPREREGRIGRAQTSREGDLQFDSRWRQTNDSQNQYLLLPSLALSIKGELSDWLAQCLDNTTQ